MTKSILWIISVFLLVLLLISCDNTYNLTEDFFPIKESSFFLTNQNNDSLLIVIEQNTNNINGLTVNSLWINTTEIYIYKNNTGIYQIDTIGNGHLFIPFPLINNTQIVNCFADTLRTIQVLEESSLYYRVIITDTINNIQTNAYNILLEANKGIIEWNGYSR